MASTTIVGYAELAPAFHMVRAFTVASTAAALALFGAAWDPRLMWTLFALTLVAVGDALYRRRRPESSPKPRLLLEGFVVLLTALLIGGPALVAAPMAYLLTAALLILPLRRALLVVAFFTACVVAVFFSTIPGADPRTQLTLGLGALLVFLAALAVLLVASARVIGEMRKRERLLLEEARAANDAKTRLLANVGHELRTPLAAVVGFAELLRDQAAGLSEQDRQAAVRSIAEQSLEVSGLIDDLLVAARYEIGELKVSRVPTNLRAQAAQVLETWDHSITAGIALEGRAAPTALADPGRVRQILRNLVSNALRYGGPHIRLVLAAEDTAAVIEVRDDGEGIPPESRERIFIAYYRDPAGREHPTSIGLGLAVSRDLARLMGGDLTYRYENGESVFALDLPLGPSEAEQPSTDRRLAERPP